MNTATFLQALKKFPVPLVATRDIADVLGIDTDSAGKYLMVLHRQQLVEKLTHGKWRVSDAQFDRLQVAAFLTAPRESYISLHSALFYHGMIEQIPTRVYAVTTARTKVISTPVGAFSFHHCHPDFFSGYEYVAPYLCLATPEKALIDYFYFSPAKSRQFTRLPELELPKAFSWRKAKEFCALIPSSRTRTLVERKMVEVRG